MKRLRKLHWTLGGVLAAGLIFFNQPVFAQEDEPDYNPAIFDNSEYFVAPEFLPLEDTSVRAGMGLSETEAKEDLQTVSITPDGKIETLDASAEEVKMFLKALRETEEAEGGGEGEGNAGEAGDAGAAPGEGPKPEGLDQLQESDSDELLTPLPEGVIGQDTRVRINGTTSYPFRTVGRIDLGCTGTLIGPRHVLTAGHCVYNIKTDKWYSSLNFTAGQNGTYKPYGTTGWKRAVSVKGWTKSHKRNFDYAMIVLKKDIGNQLGWMGYGWKKPMPKWNININGYPADKRPRRTMWHAFCKMQIITSYRLYYPCDTFGGMSGSGVYVYFKESKKRTIYGIHAYGVDSTGLNGATRIREAVFDNLKKWKNTY